MVGSSQRIPLFLFRVSMRLSDNRCFSDEAYNRKTVCVVAADAEDSIHIARLCLHSKDPDAIIYEIVRVEEVDAISERAKAK